FQSPSRRGSLGDGNPATGYLVRFQISVPFAKGITRRLHSMRGRSSISSFQSPSRRGSLGDGFLRFEKRGDGIFQSPSRRGSLGDQWIEDGYITATEISVPFAKGITRRP